MNTNQLGEDPDRIAILDEYGQRKTVIPAEVKGRFKRAMNWIHPLLILLFLILPWIYIGGHQALLLDIPRREFSFFGLKLYAHDAPLILFVLGLGVFGLALVTAVWGRVWCGWACPQTVFIESLFRKVEIWVEGTYIERRRLQAAPWSFNKIWKLSLKWFLFFVLSSIIAHSFSAYFAGSRELLRMMQGSPTENWTYFLWVSAFTALILFDFGWFREQFCIIMCPYGRFQGLLMDSKSMAVLYDEKRGEPRKGSALLKTDPALPQGDCVSCRRCVEVCPTGIDIRKGLQMDCIACTACIDACDEIMEKVKKPKGLIRYSNVENGKWSFFRPRTALYSVLILLSALGLIISLANRSSVDVVLLRGKDRLFDVIEKNSDGSPSLLVNQFRLHIKNQSGHAMSLQIKASTLDGTTLDFASSQNPIALKKEEDLHVHVFVKFPPALLNSQGRASAKIILFTDKPKPFEVEQSFQLLGPF